MRGTVEFRPERLPPPANSSAIYISLLTAPKFHDVRFSLQYLTWLQTVDPEQVTPYNAGTTLYLIHQLAINFRLIIVQVHVVTDDNDNEWIQAIEKEGKF